MTTKEQFASLWAQLGTVEGACCRAMMGEYILYYEGRVIGGIYDGRVLVKDLPAEPAWLAALFAALAAEVPSPCKNKKK